MPVAEPNRKSEIVNQKSAEVVVSVRGLTKVFKDFWNRPKARAVDNVDFEVRRGEVFGLLGPNGSGKSTTVKLLLGLLNPTKGHIEVFGHSPRHVQTKSRIGYLPEESYLYRYLNSRETLDFFGNLFQLSKGERDNRAEQLLEMVGLSQTQTRAVGEFSKGMQRRIGLAQALINDPDLVILDEPTSGLDPIGCREVKDLIVALARRGKTVILSSHLLADVEDVCDRVVIYYGGKIQAAGTLKELLADARHAANHDAGSAARNLGAGAGNHPQGRFGGRSARGQPDAKPRKLFSGRGAKGARGGGGNQRRAIRRAGGGLFARRARKNGRRRRKFWKSCPCRRRAHPPPNRNLRRQSPRQKWTSKNWRRWPKPPRRANAGKTRADAGTKPVDLSKADEKLSSLLENQNDDTDFTDFHQLILNSCEIREFVSNL